MKFLISSMLLTLVVGALLLAPRASHAGLDYGPLPQTAYCYRYSDGSGWCYGTFAGFRADSDPGTYAQVNTSTWGNGRYFSARFGGSYFSCAVNPYWGQDLKNQIEKLPMFKGQWFVQWDYNYYCNDISLSQQSYYQQ